MALDASFERSKSLSQRLYRLRNFQSKDFWAMVFARPMTILMLLPIADVAWVTPNLITAASVATKIGGIAALAWMPGYWGGVLGAILVNLGLVLDNMDGTLARYRDTSSYVGYYLDKSVDIICLAGIFLAIAWRAYQGTQESIDLMLPFAGFAGASAAAYCKWVASKVETDLNLLHHMKAGTLEDFARGRIDQNPIELPPSRSLADWGKFLFDSLKSIFLFNEVDIFFFLALALVLDKLWLFSQVMCSFYALGLIIGPALFFFNLRKRVKSDGLE